jgi:hypothetical protein
MCKQTITEYNAVTFTIVSDSKLFNASPFVLFNSASKCDRNRSLLAAIPQPNGSRHHHRQ